jgi:hypothetical protein
MNTKDADVLFLFCSTAQTNRKRKEFQKSKNNLLLPCRSRAKKQNQKEVHNKKANFSRRFFPVTAAAKQRRVMQHKTPTGGLMHEQIPPRLIHATLFCGVFFFSLWGSVYMLVERFV